MSPLNSVWALSLLFEHLFPGGSDDKASARNTGDPGSIPGLGRSPGEGNGNLLQYSCLENPMGGGAWKIPWVEEPDRLVQRVAKSQTRLSGFTSSGNSVLQKPLDQRNENFLIHLPSLVTRRGELMPYVEVFFFF